MLYIISALITAMHLTKQWSTYH